MHRLTTTPAPPLDLDGPGEVITPGAPTSLADTFSELETLEDEFAPNRYQSAKQVRESAGTGEDTSGKLGGDVCCSTSPPPNPRRLNRFGGPFKAIRFRSGIHPALIVQLISSFVTLCPMFAAARCLAIQAGIELCLRSPTALL